MIGKMLGAYEVLAKLGEGGMGEVYRATDTRLGRDVALKVLPDAFAHDQARIDRFRREARTVAALNHPHIVTIYSVEESGGVHFLTMELVEGRPLDEHLRSTGMTPDALLAVARPLADALAAAHDRGIVHRDLKPANVMITADGRVKVLDFGLARLDDGAMPGSDLETMARTSEGVVMGTVPYMSPEQVEGKTVDHRSDIFSLGVMLHEMATGARPFQGTSQAALLSAILRDSAPAIRARRPDMPEALCRVIDRCLQKDRDRRIQTARDVRNELDAIGAAPASLRKSIVVLPFANLSPDVENEFFSDGLTEELIADLSKVKALSVISRTSSMQLKGVKKDARTLGRELGVQYVLDGGVRKAGNSLRITAQLIDAATDAPVWSEKYSGTMDDVFEVQERVSREIVKALDITLTSDEHKRLGERPIADPRAFELFLQARQELRRYLVDRAITLINEAIRIEGATPPLQAILAWATVYRVRAGVSPDRTLLDDAERQARALLAKAPDAPFGYSMLGHIEYERGYLPEAIRYLEMALAKEPNDSDTLLMVVVCNTGAGQPAAALAAADRMLACDPLSPVTWMAKGVPHWFAGQPERGIADLEHGLAIDPQAFIVHWAMGYTYALVGRLADAARNAATMHAMAPDSAYTRQLLSLIDGLEGRSDAALAHISGIDVTALDAHHRFHLAESFIVAGVHDRGLDLLEQSVLGFYPYRYMAEFCPFLEPVRTTERFKKVLALAKAQSDRFEAAAGKLAAT